MKRNPVDPLEQSQQERTLLRFGSHLASLPGRWDVLMAEVEHRRELFERAALETPCNLADPVRSAYESVAADIAAGRLA